MRRLVLVHGRSQQHKDAKALKQEWLDCLQAGFQAARLELDIPDEQVAFPYYGDTLDKLSRDPNAKGPDVIVAGVGDPDQAEQAFIGSIVEQVVTKVGVPEEQIRAEAGVVAIEAGWQNWRLVLAALRALDKWPGVSAASIELITHDVWMYLKNSGIQRILDNGVRGAMTGEETVVVAHSLGTIVAYNLLAREAKDNDWTVPSLITVGCPLGISAIVDVLRPITHPVGVGEWYNAFDRADTVALFPLDAGHFPITPAVENYPDVKNTTSNHHGISGYLSDPTVARRIHDALLG